MPRLFSLCIPISASAPRLHYPLESSICVDSKDELNLIDLDLVACVSSSGRYSTVMYIDGKKIVLKISLSQFEVVIKESFAKQHLENTFTRLGSDLIVNNRYLSQINISRQTITLSDYKTHVYQITVPKKILMRYKDFIKTTYIGQQ